MKPNLLSGTVLTLALTFLLPPLPIRMASGQPPSKSPWETWAYPANPERGGYYRAAGLYDPGSMNPNIFPVKDWMIITYIYEKLFATDGSYRPVPWLVDSYHFPNSHTCLLDLKKGVRFSDGAPFNAEAVKFVTEWILDLQNGCHSTSFLKPLKSVEALGEHTLRWTFREPWGAFLGILANIPGYVISPRALKEDPGKCVTKPVGTGPYLLEERNPGSWTKVKRNSNWWFGKSIGHPDMPYFDGILTTVIPDPAVTFANLKVGKIHGMSLSKAQFDVARKDPNLKVYAVPLNTVRGYRFNHSREPFNDLRVRQAVAYAIDRQALVAGIEFGLGRVASCAYPGDHWAHNPDLKPWPYDPQKAKRLLREAGYEKGLTITGYVFSDPQARARAEAVKGMLAEVGIDWKVEFLDPAAAADRMKKRDYQLAYGDYTFIFDPDLLATSVYDPKGGYNFGRTRNEAAIALLEAGRLEVDMEKRQKIYHQLERVLYESCEDIWIFWEMAVTAYRKNVMGYDYEMTVKHKRIWETSHPFWFQGGKP